MKKFNILILFIALLLPTSIYAAFFDTEESINNTFHAATLDIKFNTAFVSSFTLPPESTKTISTILVNAGTLPSTNSLKFQYVKGNKEITEKIKLDVNGGTLYTGTLSNLNISGVVLQAKTHSDINFTLSISSEDAKTYQGQEVTFNIFDLGVQDTSIYPHGFYDSEILTFTVSIPTLTTESIPASTSSLPYTSISQESNLKENQSVNLSEGIVMCTDKQDEGTDNLDNNQSEEESQQEEIIPQEEDTDDTDNLTVDETIINEENI